MLSKVKIVLDLIVPEYILIIFTFFAIFFVLSNNFTLVPFVFVPFIIYILLLFGFNSINQVFDKNIDAITKPTRPIPSNKISALTVLIISTIFYALSLILAIFSGLASVWFVSFIATILYSHHVFGLRKFLIATPIFGVIFYILIPFFFISHYFNFEINYFILIFFSLVTICISFLKDLEDINGDKKVGFKTIPMIFGKNKSLKVTFYSLFLVISFFGITLIILNNFYFIISLFLSIIVLFSIWNFLQKKNFNIKDSKILAIFMLFVVFVQIVFSLVFII